MKKVYKLSSVFLLITSLLIGFNSCVDPDDKLTENAKEGGAVLTADKSLGKLLGVELDNGTVNFTESELNFVLEIITGGTEVSEFTIYKSLNGAEGVEVEKVTALPHTITFSTVADFLDGLNISEADLRIGDTFQFYTQMTLSDGRVVTTAPGAGTYDVVVNCSSNLGGTYAMDGIDSNGNIYSFPVTITELGPGQYQSSRSGPWEPGDSGFNSGEARMLFSDVCGVLTIAEQQLNLGQYGNLQYGEGTVDPVSGVITYEYTIEFGSGNVLYTETLTPQ